MSLGDMSEKVGLFLSASGLPKMDVTSNTDPFAVMFMKDRKTGQLVKCGRTDVIMDTQAPQWPTQFILEYFFEATQEITIRLFDKDGSGSIDRENVGHEFIGEATFTLSQLMCSMGQKLVLKLTKGTNQGMLTIKGESVHVCHDIFHCDLIGSKLANKDGWFGKSDPFLRFFRIYEDGTFALVHETPRIDNNLNPQFRKLHIPMISLCNGDIDRPIKIEIWDHEESGKHQPMGQIETSVRGLLSNSGPMDVIELDKKKKDPKGYKNSGTLQCQNASIEIKPSFVDYVIGGCEISLICAIDFTGSNGAPTDPSSLHYIHPNPQFANQYQCAINAVGRILEDYDADKMYPVYGFGAKVKLPNGSYSLVQHCFPVYGGGVEVKGVDGILQAYRDCVQNVALSGPTLFSPIIEASAAIASHSACSQANQKYSILLIITDGEINDMDNTINSIVKASTQPMSIIIIGVGQANFSSMNALDGDGAMLKATNGAVAERDIVQFVSFRDFAAKGMQFLASEVLAEVPKQFVDYMTKRGIRPNPPRGANAALPGGP